MISFKSASKLKSALGPLTDHLTSLVYSISDKICFHAHVHFIRATNTASIVPNSHSYCPSDGELYTGTVADYRGNRPVISRHLSEGRRVDLKLDDTLGWLEGESQ